VPAPGASVGAAWIRARPRARATLEEAIMIPVVTLWLPILLAAVFAFVASSIVHMALRYHKSDVHGLPDEAAIRAALGAQKLAPGQYMLPYCADMKQMKDPAVVQKYTDGPVAIVTVMPNGVIHLGKFLFRWFLYCLGVSFVVGYLASRTLAPGTPYMHVFRFTSVVAWLGYAAAHVSAGIWQGRPWSTVCKDLFDGAIFALLTGGAFGSMWPK
jgi:hypothetical protein